MAIAAVGTVSLAIQYGEVTSFYSFRLSVFTISMLTCLQGFLLSVIMGKYPDYKKTLMWSGLALYFVSLFTSSFATQVRVQSCRFLLRSDPFLPSRYGNSFSYKGSAWVLVEGASTCP